MRAVVIDRYGGPERLHLAEVPRPEPGPGQVLVRVRAAGVNPVDWKVRRGRLRLVHRPRFPLVLGCDVAGEVEAVGAEVTAFAPGDPVMCYLGAPAGGGYAEWAVASEAAVAPKPPRLSWEEAAALPLAGLTAWRALVRLGELAAGERVLVVGAAGGVGHLAVQMAVAFGAKVTAVASGRHQAFLRDLGAERTIDYQQEDWTWDDATYEVLFDAAGVSSFKQCEPLLAADGGVWVTTAAGPAIVGWSALTTLGRLAGYRKRARFVMVKADAAGLESLGRLVEVGRLWPVVAQTFDWTEAARAHELSEAGHARGKLVLRVP